MLINPRDLYNDLDRLEEIEKASLRLVVQALYEYRDDAHEIFRQESDNASDIGEDITREALDRMGMSRVDQRLFGKVDYKRARYIFHPEYALKQALFVDSKAEKDSYGVARIQITQTSMHVRQVRAGEHIDIAGHLPVILQLRDEEFLTTTAFVKYHYLENEVNCTRQHELEAITVVALPSGMLQDKYNPTCIDTIWIAGPNAPSLGEEFRTRLSFRRLQAKARWRVQKIPMSPHPFSWIS
ncbi:MAG: type II restriction enzyme, SfiI family [Chloroflexi bacterium AL-W]|nr:type II restriction enzyme, SfiI family [Chloroflexi bacterium AL-N1]NOK67561.1 type II restriction enzyme, SfiI family [Chloroflexi bacterium AL-N10]NOK75669.1 type II restriction enzyme, SfiI family [Chloroflexi bacterium AL-N5]NOK82457.1 type II restriction enzyme, SfiI family [Chloroflexi bacterium AL-W]NOK90302.1 type II restriction enzyme, SfiI family [Chloroflexi bacterium AL-N15]